MVCSDKTKVAGEASKIGGGITVSAGNGGAQRPQPVDVGKPVYGPVEITHDGIQSLIDARREEFKQKGWYWKYLPQHMDDITVEPVDDRTYIVRSSLEPRECVEIIGDPYSGFHAKVQGRKLSTTDHLDFLEALIWAYRALRQDWRRIRSLEQNYEASWKGVRLMKALKRLKGIRPLTDDDKKKCEKKFEQFLNRCEDLEEASRLELWSSFKRTINGVMN